MNGDASYDVIVVGGGVGGVAAACGARALGARTALIERYGALGGVATHAGVGTICGALLRSTRGNFWGCSRYVRTFVERYIKPGSTEPQVMQNGIRYLSYPLADFHHFCAAELTRCKVSIELHGTVFGLNFHSNGGTLDYLAWNERRSVSFGSIVDASGESLLSKLAGIPLSGLRSTQLPTLTIAVSGVSRIPDERLFNVALAKECAAIGTGRVSLLIGSRVGDTALLKFTPQESDLFLSDDRSRIEYEMREQGRELVEQLKQCGAFPVEVRETGAAAQTGFRLGALPVGMTVLAEADVLGLVKPDNGVATGSWPIEEWVGERLPKLRYFPEEGFYLIPPGALRSATVPQLYFAGRGIAAEPGALASARVIGTALASGYAAGALAAARILGIDEREVTRSLRAEALSEIGESY